MKIKPFDIEKIQAVENKLVKLSSRKITGIELIRLRFIVCNLMFQREWVILENLYKEKRENSDEYKYFLKLLLQRWGLSRGKVGYLKKIEPSKDSSLSSYTFEIDINQPEKYIKKFLLDVVMRSILDSREFMNEVHKELGEGYFHNLNYPNIMIPYEDTCPDRISNKYSKRDLLETEKKYQDIIQAWTLRQTQINGKPTSWTRIAKTMCQTKAKVRHLVDRDFEDLQRTGIPGFKPFPNDCLRYTPSKSSKKSGKKM